MLPPIRPRMAPKLGSVSAMNKIRHMMVVRKRISFPLTAETEKLHFEILLLDKRWANFNSKKLGTLLE